MRARWVQSWESPTPPTVAATTVARWLPNSYLSVSTLELRAKSDDAMAELLNKLDPNRQDTWVTQVFRCDRYGLARNFYDSLYSREYSDVDAAKRGHEEIVRALREGKYIGAALGFTPEQTLRLAWLRAAEWMAWPAFISQPLLPILYLFWPWYYVLSWVALATLMWRAIRYRFLSYRLAAAGCFFVRLKWPVMLVVTIYFALHHEYFLAVLALCSPLVSMALSALSPGMVGAVQRRIVGELMFESDLQALADAEAKSTATTPS
jgi:hypothetical protein